MPWSALLSYGPWVLLAALVLVLTYKVTAIALVRSSKGPMTVRDKLTGLTVERPSTTGNDEPESPDRSRLER